MTKLCTVTDEIAAKAKSENPGSALRVCRYEAADVVIKASGLPAYQRFLDEVSNTDTRGSAQRNLVYACVVFPAEKDFTAIIEQRPGLISAIGADVMELSGFKAAAEKKDL